MAAALPDSPSPSERERAGVRVAPGARMMRAPCRIPAPPFDHEREVSPVLVKVLAGIAAVVLVFVGVVAFQPADFRIVRKATMSAPAPAVFAQVNDLHKWEAWSPWIKRDPAARTAYEGAPAGQGATFRWAGNKDVGEGSMTITESRPGELIRIRLEFLKPFAAANAAEFRFEPAGDRTTVTWSMEGRNGFISKAISLFLDMDRMVGGDFEAGLAAIKSMVEAAPKG